MKDKKTKKEKKTSPIESALDPLFSEIQETLDSFLTIYIKKQESLENNEVKLY